MSQAHFVLNELAGIGAKIESNGTRLILRAGATEIPASLVRRVRDAKNDLIAILSLPAAGEQQDEFSIEARLVQWLDQNPVPSPAGRCAWCGHRETSSAVVVPFGTVPGTHTWLHPRCWRPWQLARRATAISNVQAGQL